MYIKVTIIDNNTPFQITFKGNYALETMLTTITERYFGKRISLIVEDLLKKRVDES